MAHRPQSPVQTRDWEYFSWFSLDFFSGMFLDAKRYNFPVASCPVSIFKYQKHQQCNPSTVSWKLIDSNSKLYAFRRSFLFYRLFANKYKIQVIKDIDEEMDLFPLYIEHQKVIWNDLSWFLVLLSLWVAISLQIDPYTLQDHQRPLEQIPSAFCHYWQYILHFSLYFTRGADWWCFCWYSCSLGQPLASILIFFSFIA